MGWDETSCWFFAELFSGLSTSSEKGLVLFCHGIPRVASTFLLRINMETAPFSKEFFVWRASPLLDVILMCRGVSLDFQPSNNFLSYSFTC